MDANMPDAENQYGQQQKNTFSIYREKEKSRDRKCRASYRHAEQAAVKIRHRLFAAKIPDPINLIKHHEQKGQDQPPGPTRPWLQIKIREK